MTQTLRQLSQTARVRHGLNARVTHHHLQARSTTQFPNLSASPQPKPPTSTHLQHPTSTLPNPNATALTRHPHHHDHDPQRTQTRTMSSDADYAAFLDKANQDTSGAASTTTSTQKDSDGSKPARTKAVNAAVPKALDAVDEYYVSDADEPFEPVSLEWGGEGELGSDEFAKLIGRDAMVEEFSEKEFDPQGQYKNVFDAVSKAGDGSVKIFRMQLGGTRVEYFVVSVDKEEGRVVGLMAFAVES